MKGIDEMISGKSLCTMLFLLSFCFPRADSQEYNFRNLSSSEGLVQPYVYSVTQDSHGYLWIGTGEGVSRYDGFTIKSFTVSDSLAENFVTSSVSDENYLWFGHRNGRISFYDGKKFRQVIYPGKKLSPVTYLAKSPDGKIWMSTRDDGLFRIDKDRIVPGVGKPLENAGISCFEFAGSDELLVATGSGLLRCKPGNEPETCKVVPVNEFAGMIVPVVKKMRNGKGFFVATANDGIFELTIDGNNVRTEKIFASQVSYLTSLQTLCEDNLGNVWLGSFGNGLVKLSQSTDGEGKIAIYNQESGFSTDNVKIVYEDNEGNIWSGNYGDGITQISPKLFSLKSYNKTVFGSSIFSICRDEQVTWLGTEKGLLKIEEVNGKVVKFYGKGSGLAEDTITAISRQDEKEIWIGTDKSGLFRLNTGSDRIVRYALGEGNLENSITTIACQQGVVWAGTKKGLCRINPASNDSKWYSVSQGGLPNNWVNSIFSDSKGLLWVSTGSSVLAYIKNGKVTRIPLRSAPGLMTLGPIAEDTLSRIWVGTRGNGLYILESDSAISLTDKGGLFSNYCYSMTSIDGHIWVGHKGAFSTIHTSDLLVTPIQHIDDLPAEYRLNPNAIATDKSNRIWFGSDLGLICYDPSGDISIPAPPVLNINSVRINGTEKTIDNNKIVLSPGTYDIRIDFLGVSLREPELVNYRYKLENFGQWSDISKNTSATFNHLTDGNYSFILKAYGGAVTLSADPLIISIIIKKPVWKKWWFYPVCTAILGLLVLVYVKWKLKKLIEEKRFLEKKVLERTIEIQSQKEEIEQQRDLIERKNINITSSIEYASNIQNAVLPSAELIEKLLPESFILSKPRDIVSGDFYWLTEKKGKIIIIVADCTGHGVPGAFMSLLGITLLNEIVDSYDITESDIIVTRLREFVVQLLQQDRKDITTRDGMDIAVCVIDPVNSSFQYTGAMNDLVFVTGGRISVVKADRMSVSAAESYEKFTLHELSYKKGDMIYLFTDGYKDQFGGEFDKKFLKTAFYTTLFEVSSIPLTLQKVFLENKLTEWMKNNEQTDDITVMGIRM
jgi:ligand-binding sensor domain-containing protein/serine phosphatase RsbU (regulator of sigma subunit)